MAFITPYNGKRGRTYKVHYTDPKTGKRRAKSFSRRKDADHFINEIPKSGYVHDRDSCLVSEAVDRWLFVCENEGRKGREPVESATLKPYKRHAKYIKARIGGERLNTLTSQRCQRFVTELLADFSRPYAKKIFVSFKSVLSQARDDARMTHDPCESVGIVLTTRDGPKDALKMPTIEEIKTLLKQAEAWRTGEDKRMCRTWSRYARLFRLIAVTGMRPGEALGLPWREVYFDANEIRVTQDLDEDGKIGRPKSQAGYRTIPVSESVMADLKEWKKQCPRSKEDLLFPKWNGRPEQLPNVTRRGWHRLQEQCKILELKKNKNGVTELKPKYRLTDLRHVRASLEIHAGANPKEIMRLMGHSSIRVTFDVYGSLFTDHDQQRAERATQVTDTLIGNLSQTCHPFKTA